MGIYEIAMSPLENNGLTKIRKKLIVKAYGDVLEIGAGNGVNLDKYDFTRVDSLVMTDIELPKNAKNLSDSKISYLSTSAESLPFADKSFDCVVETLVFCTVDVQKALSEVKRVLKDDGKFIYIEHIAPSKPFLNKTVNFINPLWRKIANGCNLNRDFESELKTAGFTVDQQQSFFKDIFIAGIASKNNTSSNI